MIDTPPMAPAVPVARPSLLVSVHDVSPLTLEACRRAVTLAESSGVPREALTLLAIPRHEDRVSLDEHSPTRDWLRALSNEGATVVTHGYTHRMVGRCFGPNGLFWAHGFARGQAELFRADEADASRRIAAAVAVMCKAGLAEALQGFVPPAWLLSAGALAAVRRANFGFYEQLGGIVRGQQKLARRVIGFGSLTAAEARLTALYASWQAGRSATDTRLAIHPVDLERPFSARAVERVLRRLLEILVPRSYAQYLRAAR